MSCRGARPRAVLAVLERGFAQQRMAARLVEMEARLDERFGVAPFTGRSRAIARVMEQVRHLASTHTAVLIEGRPGPGSAWRHGPSTRTARDGRRRSRDRLRVRSPSRCSSASCSVARKEPAPTATARHAGGSIRPTVGPCSERRRRPPARGAGEVAARASGSRLRARRRAGDGQGRCAADRRHPARPRSARARGPVPRGPLPPLGCGADRDAAPCAIASTISRCWSNSSCSRRGGVAVAPAGPVESRAACSTGCWRIRGLATCASCATRSRAW